MRMDLEFSPTDPEKQFWHANVPNPFTSDKGIVKDMYFGRAIPVPGNRIFAISGCADKNAVTGITRQTQRWDLRTMKVELMQPIKYGRTSFAAFYKGRYIYVLGGNIASFESTLTCVRFNIVTLLWENLPSLLNERANCASFVTSDEKYLYAFGGFNFPGAGQ